MQPTLPDPSSPPALQVPYTASGQRRSLLRDFSLPAVVAGFVKVLVGFSSSAVIVFEAARGLGASDAQIASWMWALGLGIGLLCIVPSMILRVPVAIAWSTPGAAMLITSGAGVPLPHAIGAFMVCAALIALTGFSGIFERAMKRLPMGLASAMLAGVLLKFGIDVFAAMQTRFVLVVTMFVAWLFARRLWPRYAVVVALLAGVVMSFAAGELRVSVLRPELAVPIFTAPQFDWTAVAGIALPLYVVTMATQNLPGVAVSRACGYASPVSPIIGWTGVVTFVLAPFGAFSLCLAAITAAIVSGPEAHPDIARRYVAAVAAGVFYILVGVFGATVTAVFAAFPRELVLAIAGLALLGNIASGLQGALADARQRDAALVTFLVTASGLTLVGVGSAFWGLVAGLLTLAVLDWRVPRLFGSGRSS